MRGPRLSSGGVRFPCVAAHETGTGTSIIIFMGFRIVNVTECTVPILYEIIWSSIGLYDNSELKKSSMQWI